MKRIFIDTETTGISTPSHGILQIAGAIEIDGEVVESFDFPMRPHKGDNVTEDALAINGIKRAELNDRPEPNAAYKELCDVMAKYVNKFDTADKLHMVAYNAPFDAGHLRAWFGKCGDRYYGSWFWHPPIDVMCMAAYVLADQRHTMANFRLATVAEQLGITVAADDLHDADYDIKLTRDVFLATERLLLGAGEDKDTNE